MYDLLLIRFILLAYMYALSYGPRCKKKEKMPPMRLMVDVMRDLNDGKEIHCMKEFQGLLNLGVPINKSKLNTRVNSLYEGDVDA